MAVSDEALLAGMAADDPDAAAVFVRRHQARVYGLALLVVGIPAVAEEVAQEAFVRAWRHADGFDPRRGRATTWLLAITRHAAIDVVRMRRGACPGAVVAAVRRRRPRAPPRGAAARGTAWAARGVARP